MANRYRSAFEMIAGHPFTPELWWRLFGPLKFSELLGGLAATLSAPVLHHLRTPARRPVPDSRVSPQTDQEHTVGITEGGSPVRDDIKTIDLLIDLRDLIGRGLSDEEIAQRLDLKNPKVVAYFRLRADDFGSI